MLCPLCDSLQVLIPSADFRMKDALFFKCYVDTRGQHYFSTDYLKTNFGVTEKELIKMSKVTADTYFASAGGAKFFKAADIKGEEARIKITKFREANLPNTGKTPVIDFTYNREERSLPLNKTNFKKLIEKLGNETNEWIGETITLYTVMANNPKTNSEAPSIRVK